MTIMKLIAAAALGVAAAEPSAAQSQLFETTLASAVRQALPGPSRAVREHTVNRVCPGCEERPGSVHFIVDSPLLTDDWVAHHEYRGTNRAYGDGKVVADFWYDAIHRRIYSRSAVFHEVDDPADLRLGRAPGRYPNTLDFDARLQEGTTVGQVGFDKWTDEGFTSYFAAMQGTIRDDQTGYLVLATAMGRPGVTRTGSTFEPDDLVRHVRLHPSGQLEVGFETPLEGRTDALLVVRGDAVTEGSLVARGPLTTGGSLVAGGSVRIDGTGGNVPHACTVRSATARARAARVACEPLEVAVSGGGSCEKGDLKGSRPLQAGASPDGWEISCGRSATQTAYAICCAY